MGVINKADLVHNIVHEGLHAAVGGEHNLPRPRGGSNGPSLEEEREGFRVGNAAATALGLPPENTVPQVGSYNVSPNPAYPLLFPGLAPPGTPPPTVPTPAPAPVPAPAPDATDGDKQVGSLPLDALGDPAKGYCSNTASGWDCDGPPGVALVCDSQSLGDNACALAENDLASPCSFSGGGWMCDETPP